MSSSLLDSLTSLAGPNLVSAAATQLGEQPQAVSHGLTVGFGAILAGLVSKATDGGGLKQIFDLVSGNSGLSQVLSNPTELLGMLPGGGGTAGGSSVASAGQQFLSAALPGSMGQVTNLIAKTTGMQPNSVTSLLGMAAPLVMGVLGKRIRDQGLNAASLGNLLSSEKDSILRTAPAGLGNLVGLTDTAREAAGRVVGGVSSAATGAATSAGGGRLGWILGIIVALLAAFWGISRCQRDKPDIAANMSAATDSLSRMGESAGAHVGNAMSAATSALGALVSRALPNGTTLNVPANGIESKLIAFVTDAKQPVSDTVWFDFDRLLFETGSATLKPESQEQVKNIADVLTAFPNVNAKIGGYTDNTGNATANLALSQRRADAVKKALVGLGIADGRLAAEGYGDAHPVADNGTEEGRAKNRRIALRVTKK